jgi:hypothetical protein
MTRYSIYSKNVFCKALWSIGAMVLFASCSSIKPMGISNELYQGYQPIEPLPVKCVEVYQKERNDFSTKPWASLSDSTIRDILPNQSAQISLRKTDINGKLSYMVASVTEEAGSYEVTMDYMKYRVEDVNIDSVYIGSGRIGIGLRIKAVVTTNKANLNLSGLTNLGVEANSNNLSGQLSVDIIGIDSKDITNYLPLTAKLDETSIQNALQSVATIKSKIWDNNVKLTPHLIAIYQKQINSEKLIKEKLVSVGTFSYTNTGEIINTFWCPDGENVNKDNEKRLLQWMQLNGMQTGAGSITDFIYSSEKSDLRTKAINDLKIESYGRKNP